MKKWMKGLLPVWPVLAILLILAAGCSTAKVTETGGAETGDAETGASETAGGPAAECPYPEGIVLPQVFYLGKIYYSEEDLAALEANVVQPLVDYFASIGQTVVSIDIDSDNRGSSEKSYFSVTVIVSKNDGTNDPVHLGFLHYKVDGEIPVWEMETME